MTNNTSFTQSNSLTEAKSHVVVKAATISSLNSSSDMLSNPEDFCPDSFTLLKKEDEKFNAIYRNEHERQKSYKLEQEKFSRT